MKFFLLCILMTCGSAYASGKRWVSVKLPLCILDVSEGGSELTAEIWFVTASRDIFESRVAMMNSKHIPSGHERYTPADTNLVTLYGFKISHAYNKIAPPAERNSIITINTTSAVRPEGYPLKVKEVTERVLACVKENFPETAFEIRVISDEKAQLEQR